MGKGVNDSANLNFCLHHDHYWLIHPSITFQIYVMKIDMGSTLHMRSYNPHIIKVRMGWFQATLEVHLHHDP